MMKLLAVAIGATFASGAIYGQDFEVASVKPAAPTAQRGGRMEPVGRSIDPGQVRYTSTRLKWLLRDAYRVQAYQVTGPAWLEDEKYDVVAKLPEGASQDQIPAMLQNLLLERFQIKVHSEMKQERVYALLAGKGVSHLKEFHETEDHSPGMSFDTSGHMKFVGTSLSGLANAMSNLLDRPMVDMTGIEGRFDIPLNVSMEDLVGLRKLISAAGGTIAAVPDADAPSSIFTAIQEIGLKLEVRTAPIQHVVVDRAEKVPTGN